MNFLVLPLDTTGVYNQTLSPVLLCYSCHRIACSVNAVLANDLGLCCKMISFVYEFLAQTVGKSVTWLGECGLALHQLEVMETEHKLSEME